MKTYNNTLQTPWDLHRNWPQGVEDLLLQLLHPTPPHLAQTNPHRLPHLDLSDHGPELRVEMEAPGMKPESFDITLEENTLKIIGKKEKPPETLNPESPPKTLLVGERTYGEFQRQVRLPHPVQPQNIQATYQDGVLQIRMPKTEEAQAKKISVQR